MTSLTIAQSDSQIQSTVVYEYCLTVVNTEDKDTQYLTAAFSFLPTSEDWQQWLKGWNSCGYSTLTQPQLVRTL